MTTSTDGHSTEALVERLFGATLGALELFSVHLGVRLGLYDVLAGAGRMGTKEVAAAAGIDERYAREWLEQQAAAGFLDADGADAGSRTFRLPDAHHAVLVDVTDPSYVAPFALMLAGIGEVLPGLVEAYRSGGGVPFSAYGADMRDGQAAINRPTFTTELPQVWLPALPDVHERLQSPTPARIADIGCGVGWASIALAKAYPNAQVDGFDLDVASITDARRNAAAAGVGDRATFSTTDLADASLAGRYDFACILEALHDMARPVEVLSAARALLAAGAPLLVADERVAETFAAPGDEIERVMYGWSVLHCLPAAMTEPGSAATGTAMRPDTLRGYASAAGFSSVDVLDVENDFFRLYRLSG